MTPHYHCPNDCGDHPQPFHAVDGRYLCGRCYFKYNEQVEMVACTPETCPGEPEALIAAVMR